MLMGMYLNRIEFDCNVEENALYFKNNVVVWFIVLFSSFTPSSSSS
jgi:hypothetical protein